MVKTLAPMAPFTAEDIYKHAHPSSATVTTSLFKTPWIATVHLTHPDFICCVLINTFRTPIGTNPI